MPVTQRCNYAGPLGKPVPTRPFVSACVAALALCLRGLASLPRQRR